MTSIKPNLHLRRNIVHKIEEGQDPRDIYCTTYQMRNFYAQFADGFFSSLDVMNYIQHHAAVLKMKKGWRVLDVCCGRGLLLPMIRYYKPQISEYVGIDISQNNLNEQLRRSGIKKIDDAEEYYPFKITHIHESIEDLLKYIEPNSFDFIVYTSSIEHMQPSAGLKSLYNCFEALKQGHEMFFSCPNTNDKRDSYDTQYAAHVYEWGIKELEGAMKEVGFKIIKQFGLVSKVREFEFWLKKSDKEELKVQYSLLKEYLPTTWLMPYISILYPEAASEILMIVEKPDKRGLFF